MDMKPHSSVTKWQFHRSAIKFVSSIQRKCYSRRYLDPEKRLPQCKDNWHTYTRWHTHNLVYNHFRSRIALSALAYIEGSDRCRRYPGCIECILNSLKSPELVRHSSCSLRRDSYCRELSRQRSCIDWNIPSLRASRTNFPDNCELAAVSCSYNLQTFYSHLSRCWRTGPLMCMWMLKVISYIVK